MQFNDRRKKPVKSAEEWMPKKPVEGTTLSGSRSRKTENPHKISDEQIKGIEKSVAERKKAKSQYNSINTEEHKRY
jgi:hypothetical protein